MSSVEVGWGNEGSSRSSPVAALYCSLAAAQIAANWDDFSSMVCIGGQTSGTVLTTTKNETLGNGEIVLAVLAADSAKNEPEASTVRHD